MAAKLADDIFNRIFFNENVWISIKISLKFVSKGRIDSKSSLFQVMAWRRTGDKPLLEQSWPDSLTIWEMSYTIFSKSFINSNTREIMNKKSF